MPQETASSGLVGVQDTPVHLPVSVPAITPVCANDAERSADSSDLERPTSATDEEPRLPSSSPVPLAQLAFAPPPEGRRLPQSSALDVLLVVDKQRCVGVLCAVRSLVPGPARERGFRLL
jgi:hypothetical protein